jgi:hypothetical protein
LGRGKFLLHAAGSLPIGAGVIRRAEGGDLFFHDRE